MKKIIFIFVIAVFAFAVRAQQVSGLAGWNIVLDPGHSFKENMGVSGFSEAEKNLRVAWALRDLLMTYTDIDTVYLTRLDDNTNVGLSQRSAYANALGAAWFHSIHSDATGSGGASATNSVLLLWGQNADYGERAPGGGKGMADRMVDYLSRGMRLKSAGSRGDCYFYNTGWCPYLSVTRNTLMPAELSEAGYHTNPTQNQRQMNSAFNKLEAYTLFWSILKYHDIPLPVNPILTGIISDLERDVPINGARVEAGGQSYTTDSYESVFHNYSSDPEALRNGFYLLDGLPSGAIEIIASAPDYYSDTLQVTAADTFFTFADVKLVWKRPPTVTISVPAAGYQRQAAWGTLSFTFNRPVDRASVEAAFSIQPEANGAFYWSDGDRRMLFKADTLQFEADYNVTIAASARDKYNHPWDGNGDGEVGDDYILNFRTGSRDMSAPRIAAVYPPANATAIDARPVLNIAYDEIIDSTSVTPNLFTLQKNATSVTVQMTYAHYVVGGRSILSFFPAVDLEPDQLYSLIIAPGLRDLIGNQDASTKTYRFKAGSAFWRTKSIDNFESGTANWWDPAMSGTTTGTIPDSTRSFASPVFVNSLFSSTLALGIDYGWDAAKSDWILREYLNSGAPKSVIFNKSNQLQVYIFGDNSGTLFRFAVDDRVPVSAAGNHEVSPWYKINWYGWRLISWDMSSEAAGTWLGDGQLDGSLAFDSIQLAYEEGSALSGTIYFDDLRIADFSAVGVENKTAALPAEFALLQNHPNPFNPSTTIRYDVSAGIHDISLQIYDLLGRPVRTLVSSAQAAGPHDAVWDGRDNDGRMASSGIYLYQLKTPTSVMTRRMAFIK